MCEASTQTCMQIYHKIYVQLYICICIQIYHTHIMCEASTQTCIQICHKICVQLVSTGTCIQIYHTHIICVKRQPKPAYTISSYEYVRTHTNIIIIMHIFAPFVMIYLIFCLVIATWFFNNISGAGIAQKMGSGGRFWHQKCPFLYYKHVSVRKIINLPCCFFNCGVSECWVPPPPPVPRNVGWMVFPL